MSGYNRSFIIGHYQVQSPASKNMKIFEYYSLCFSVNVYYPFSAIITEIIK